MSTIPNKISKENSDSEILRVGMIAELDAINLYEQMANTASSNTIRKTLLDIAKEEKTHMGEFETLLIENDNEQLGELKNACKEVREKTGIKLICLVD
jgi:rubrerythrin